MGEIVMLQKEMQYVDLSEFFSEEESIKLPLLGTVAAGLPILADENIEEYLSIPKSIVRNDVDGFLLRVKGDSMIDDHIKDGDILLCKLQPTAKNGDIVVAVIDGEATVKRYYREKNRVRLQPANKKFKPIYLDEDFIINGIVKGVIRYSD